MAKDIFSMSQKEFKQKFKQLHDNIKEENAGYGLPTTGYSDKYKAFVDTYKDGKVVKVDVSRTTSNPSKIIIYSGY